MVDREDLFKKTEPGKEADKPLVFATDDDISAVLSEMDEDKQPFQRPQQTEEEFEDFEPEEKIISPSQKKRINQTSEFVITYIDKSIATALAIWSKSGDSKQFEADPEDIDELAEYWGVYFQDQEIALPPWVMAAIVTVIVLSKKVNHAIHIKKLNSELAAEKELTKSLNDEISTLKKEKEIAGLKDQIEKLKGAQK